VRVDHLPPEQSDSLLPGVGILTALTMLNSCRNDASLHQRNNRVFASHKYPQSQQKALAVAWWTLMSGPDAPTPDKHQAKCHHSDKRYHENSFSRASA